jgi:DNA-binding transcriptional ArsR family regulator
LQRFQGWLTCAADGPEDPQTTRLGEMLRKQLLDTTRGRIVTLLQAEALTADDIASKLGLTRSAVRVHLTAMERDGVVARAGKRAGTTRPSNVYELTPSRISSVSLLTTFQQIRWTPFCDEPGRASPTSSPPERAWRDLSELASRQPVRCSTTSLVP